MLIKLIINNILGCFSVIDKAMCDDRIRTLQLLLLLCEECQLFFTNSNITVRASMICSFYLLIPYTNPIFTKILLYH